MGIVKVAQVFEQVASTSTFAPGQLFQLITPNKTEFNKMSVNNKGWIIVGDKKDIMEFLALHVHTIETDTQKLYFRWGRPGKEIALYQKIMLKIITAGAHGVAEYITKGASNGIKTISKGSKYIGDHQLFIKSKGTEHSVFQTHQLFCAAKGIRGSVLARALGEYSGKVYKIKLKGKQLLDNSEKAIQIGKDGALLPYGATESYYNGIIEPQIEGQSLSSFAQNMQVMI